MQNAQNTEIQQRVINLVELYRTKVGKESQIAKDAKADHDYWEQESIEMAIEAHDAGESFFGGLYGEGPHTEIWIKNLKVNEQLLGHFYAEVAGKDADKAVLDQLLPDVYDTTVFSSEEETFLKLHFKEMVNYIILTPCDESLELVSIYDAKDVHLIPKEVLNLVADRISIHKGSEIYNPFTGFAQFTNLYKDCKFYCEESYELFKRKWNAFCNAANISSKLRNVGFLHAWMKVALYANAIDVEVIENGDVPSSYDAVLSFLPQIPKIEDNEAFDRVSKIEGMTVASMMSQAFQNLKVGGVMGLLIPCNQLYENEKQSTQFKAFLEMIIKERALSEIIQLPQVMSNHAHFESFCLLIAKKGRQENGVTLIDARTANDIANTKHYMVSFDINKFHAIMDNGGIEPLTGFRKAVRVSANNLSRHLLAPEVYTIERPSKAEHPVPLSSLCKLESSLVRDVRFNLSEDTPWITMSDLTPLFTGDMNLSAIKIAGCPNNPSFVKGSKDYAFDKDGKFVDSVWGQMNTKKGHRVLEYRECTFLDGNTDTVLYDRSYKHGVRVAIVRAMGKPYVVSKDILVFSPENDIDANSLAALLRMPVVYRQLAAYEKYGVGAYLDDVLAPTDKRIIHDEKLRMQNEQNVVGDLEEKLSKKEKSLRMRKHALTQSLSSIKAMFVALDSYRKRKDGHLNDEDAISRIQGTTVQDAFEFIHKGILEMMPALEHIADVEYSFSKAESFDPEEFMDNFIAKEEKGWLNFKPIVTWKKGSNKAKTNIYNDEDGPAVIVKGQPLNRIKFPKNALEKIFENIISNAKAYAFTDDTRKDYQLKFSWHTVGTSFIIEIENNGTPIPEDRDTTSLLEYGVSTALHHDGHNGIGCNEIDSIMRQYNGKVEIVSTPKELFTVKYVLTFKDSYTYLPN